MSIPGHLLSLLIWVPIVGGCVVLALGNGRVQAARWTSLLVSVITLVLCVPLYVGFSNTTAAMQFTESSAWIPAVDSQFHVGIDGISLPLILLTTFTTVLVMIAGWGSSEKRVSQ
jgi:NADH-quinone oxidoreductase subunit M